LAMEQPWVERFQRASRVTLKPLRTW